MSIVQELTTELKSARAPTTKIRVACIIETQKSKYCGHNSEEGSRFVHAEENAVKAMKKDCTNPRIKTVYIASYGRSKMSRVAPCYECFGLILPFLTRRSRLILFEPGNFRSRMMFTYRQMIDAYSKRGYSEIRGRTPVRIMEDLRKKTRLSGRELRFVANLRLFGLAEGIQFYITGGKSGRGGIGTVINERRESWNGDLDLVAVSGIDRKVVESKFYGFAKKFFDIRSKRRVTIDIYFINEKREKINFYDRTGRQIIELCVGKSLRGAMTRMYYYNNNWWHRIS